MPKPTAIKEADVLIQCKALLEIMKGYGRLDFWRVNGGASLIRGIKTKNSGMAGFSDIMVLFKHSIAVAFIELKATDGRQSEEQVGFQRRVELMGHKYYLCRSLDDMKEILIQNGVPPILCQR